MKKLLILPLIFLLTACVTYYYPQTALEDGVYYSADDPAYANPAVHYDTVVYYPWRSLDHFYLGYYPYLGYGFGGYGYGGFSVGVSYGFSPWYPDYGYYSPWYGPYYRYARYPGWYPYYHDGRGYYSHRHNKKKYKKSHRRGQHDRYAGSSRDNRRNIVREPRVRSGHRSDNGRRVIKNRKSQLNLSAFTPPPGYSGNLERQAKNPQAKNLGKRHVEPVNPARLQSVGITPLTRGQGNPKYRSDGALAGSVPPSGSTPVTRSPSRSVAFEGNGGGTTRSAPVRSSQGHQPRSSPRASSRKESNRSLTSDRKSRDRH